MVRLLHEIASVLKPGTFKFCDRSRAAKRRMNAIAYVRGSNKVKLYKQLIQNAKETKDYLNEALGKESCVVDTFKFMQLKQEARSKITLTVN